MHDKITAPGRSGITGAHFPQGFPKTCCDARRDRSFPCSQSFVKSPGHPGSRRDPSLPVQTHSGTRQRPDGSVKTEKNSGQPVPGRPDPRSSLLSPRDARSSAGSSGEQRLRRDPAPAAAAPGDRGCRSRGLRRARAERGGAGTHRGGGRGRLGLREPVGGGAVGAARGEQPGRRGRAGAGRQPGVGAVEAGVAPLPHVREVGHLPQAEPPHHGRAAAACPGPAPARAALPAPAAPGRRRRAGRTGPGRGHTEAGRARPAPTGVPGSHRCPTRVSVPYPCPIGAPVSSHK